MLQYLGQKRKQSLQRLASFTAVVWTHHAALLPQTKAAKEAMQRPAVSFLFAPKFMLNKKINGMNQVHTTSCMLPHFCEGKTINGLSVLGHTSQRPGGDNIVGQNQIHVKLIYLHVG